MSIGEMGSVSCQFGINTVVGTVIAKNEIYCMSPLAEQNEIVNVSVAFGKSNFIPLNETFEYGEVFDFESGSSRGQLLEDGLNNQWLGFHCPTCYCKFDQK